MIALTTCQYMMAHAFFDTTWLENTRDDYDSLIYVRAAVQTGTD